MSKTQLQTNNAKLSALITELQGKAAGGGGGGGVETCTVTITYRMLPPDASSGNYYYTSPDMIATTGTWSGNNFTVTVAKGTVFVLTNYGSTNYTISGDASLVLGGTAIITYMLYSVFHVNGDCTITYTP